MGWDGMSSSKCNEKKRREGGSWQEGVHIKSRSFNTVVLKLQQVSESPGAPVKAEGLGHQPQSFSFVGLGWDK